MASVTDRSKGQEGGTCSTIYGLGRKQCLALLERQFAAATHWAALETSTMILLLESTVERSRPVPSVVCGHARKVAEKSARTHNSTVGPGSC